MSELAVVKAQGLQDSQTAVAGARREDDGFPALRSGYIPHARARQMRRNVFGTVKQSSAASSLWWPDGQEGEGGEKGVGFLLLVISGHP